MAHTLDTAKKLKASMLKIRVQSYLQKNHDWKVSKAITTGVPLSQSDINFRNSIVAEYNQRLALLNQATTEQQIDSIAVDF